MKPSKSLVILLSVVFAAVLWLSRLPVGAAILEQLSPGTIVVTTAAELEAALSPANSGARIVVRAGEYEVAHSLKVPDGATLVGEGVMSFDEGGLPVGIAPTGRTVLKSAPTLVGDFLTLGDGATLRRLVIADVARSVPPPQAGNVLAVVSRSPADFISASILECEVDNANPRGIAPSGPTGEGLAVFTRNPNGGQDPPPHGGSVLWVRMAQSIIRSANGGGGVFAINFAAGSQIGLVLERNVIGGELTATGGVSRPDSVSGSGVIIRSARNLYRSDTPSATPLGWNLIGGADSPSPLFVSAATNFNSLEIHSNDDAIEGFATGISVIGGRRFSPLSAPSSSNRLDMYLLGARIETVTADLALFGAASFASGVPTGDGNTARILVRQATGSGPRANLYADSVTPTMSGLGVGNRLELVGSPNAFDRSNEGFVPAPPAEFFTLER